MNERGFHILSSLDEVAKQHNATPAAIALAWLIARPSITAPIASVTSIAQLNEIMSAVSVKLDTHSINNLCI